MAAKKGASRAPARRSTAKESPPISAGTWFGTGFFCGMFACILAYVVMVPAPEDADKQEQPVAAKSTQPKPQKTRFDFFTLLPEREVIVPSEEGRPANAEDEPAVQYMLQAGSFRSTADAERRRANIILLGLDASIETVNANGDTWHRVYAGPFKLRSRLTKARALLIEEGIDTLLLKRKS